MKKASKLWLLPAVLTIFALITCKNDISEVIQNNYDVSFNNNFPTGVDTTGWRKVTPNIIRNIPEGKSIADKDEMPIAPRDPSGVWKFDGWNTAPDGTDDPPFDINTKITNNIDVYAHWTPNGPPTPPAGKHNVIFNASANGGTVNGLPQVVIQVDNGTAGASLYPTTAVHSNGTFNGWYTAQSGGTQFDTNTQIYAQTTVYAQFTVNGPVGSATTILYHPTVAGEYNVFLHVNTGSVTITRIFLTTSTTSKEPIPANAVLFDFSEGIEYPTESNPNDAGPFYWSNPDFAGCIEGSGTSRLYVLGSTGTYKGGGGFGFEPGSGIYLAFEVTTEHDDLGDARFVNAGTDPVFFNQLTSGPGRPGPGPGPNPGTTYTVTFNANGGTLNGANSIMVQANQPSGSQWPINPTPPFGQNFTGWFIAQTGGTQYQSTTLITSNTNLYAQYSGGTPNPGTDFTVTFNAGGGTFTENSQATITRTVAPNNAVGTIPALNTRQGYNHTGWTITAGGSGAFTAAMPVTANITVTAQWTQNQATWSYTVTFNAADGNWSGSTTPVIRTVTSPAATVTDMPPAPTRSDGYTFSGWKSDAGSDFTAGTTVTSDMNVYAQWTGGQQQGGEWKILYYPNVTGYTNIFLHVNTGSITIRRIFIAASTTATTPVSPTAVLFDFPQGIDYPTEANPGAGPFFWSNADFAGCVTGTGTSRQYVLESTGVYKAGGGFGYYPGAGAYLAFEYKSDLLGDVRFTTTGDGVPAIDDPISFNTLDEGGGSGGGDPTPTLYIVTFNANGATGGVAPNSITQASAGASITLPGNTGNLSKTGYTFGGWNTNAQGTGTTFTVGASYTPPIDIPLYAKWNPIIPDPPLHTVSFDANGATGGSAPGSITQTSAGASITIPGNTGNLSKTDHTFGGWNTNTAGNGNNYDANSSYTPIGSITLYAKWNSSAPNPVSYTVTLDANGGSVTPASITVTGTGSLTIANNGMPNSLPTPNRDGYQFTGWTLNGNSFNASTPVTGNITIIAQWQQQGIPSTSRASNPIITSRFTADPSAHVWSTDSNRLYLYPSTDIAPPRGCNLMDQYHVYSTDNMLDWIDHGEILRRDDLPPNPNFSASNTSGWGPHYDNAMFMWAPDAAYKPDLPKPYIFIFPHAVGGDNTNPSWGDTWKFGIAFSDSPYKDFKNDVHILKDRNGNEIMGTGALIDPCIFADDDGTYYLVTGGSQQFRIAKFAPDMKSLAEDWRITGQNELTYYHEGPWMFKRNNIYYLMYPGHAGSAGGSDDQVYAMSNSPYGPWQYRGSILDKVNTGDTSHGSIVEFKGKWYLFYHNAVLSNGDGTLRSVCVDELTFNGDGTINKVAQTTTSVAAVGPAVNKATLDSQFGAGNYTIETKYSDMQSGNYEGFDTNGTTYGAMLNTVIVNPGNPGAGQTGAYKGTGDISAGAIHNLHVDGSYVDWTQINGGSGGQALLKMSYAKGNDGSASMRVTFNGQSNPLPLSLPATGGWGTDGVKDSGFYLINLNPGNNNTIRFDGAGVNIASITIYLKQ